MTFAECVLETAKSRELLEQYDRLNGTNLSMRGSAIEIMVDQATGRVETEIPGFVAFVYECVWIPLLEKENGT